jgi:hypothetical protein
MTMDAAADLTADATATADHADGQPLVCYRHPDRETYVSCGRCERPICSGCAMMGPVGLRCRQCGKPPRSALMMLTPTQLWAGAAAGLGAGTIGGFIGVQIGFFFALCIGPFIGGLIGEAVLRATGYKRGPWMILLVGFGVIGGLLVGATINYALFVGQYGGGNVMTLDLWLRGTATGGLLYVIAAMFGAITRVR